MRAFEDRVKGNTELLDLAEIGQAVVDLVKESGMLKPKQKRRRKFTEADAKGMVEATKLARKGDNTKKRPKVKKKAGLGVVPDAPMLMGE